MLLLGVVVGLLALLVAGLLRSHAEILRALHELGVSLDPRSPGRRATNAATPSYAPARAGGADAHDLVGVSPSNDAVSIGVVGSQQPTLLAFLTSGCLTCQDFWDAFDAPDQLKIPGDARPVIVTKAGADESLSQVRRLAPSEVPVVMSSDMWRAYDVPVAPYFVYVDGPSGKVVGEGAASTWDQVRSLLGQALADAGLEVDKRGRRGANRLRPLADHDRGARVDRDLAAAGITPGHPSLYPKSEDDLKQPVPPETDER